MGLCVKDTSKSRSAYSLPPEAGSQEKKWKKKIITMALCSRNCLFTLFFPHVVFLMELTELATKVSGAWKLPPR